MVIDISKDKQIFLFHSVSPVDLALSMKHLVTMIGSGLAIDESLEVLVKQVEDPMLKKVYGDIHKDVVSGKTLTKKKKKNGAIF